ncbi:GNAT family N-acetyltransferase [Paenibacillus profundus]|uniref:GNAT family N-acetyltransferase n=1 Tax=Paenibacillus profundus TaxID=1173085 RepID=A0ABS8YER2_9BACL|nr:MULTISPECIES: GNAT family N-acetyltransferase [Paenibacillus]MCE5169000.1 GNAT family N-acetyltransferase [Paenibacillus profundus]
MDRLKTENQCDNVIEIVHVGEECAELLAEIGAATFRETFGELFQPDTLAKYVEATFAPGKLAVSLQKPHNHFYVAYWDGKPAGYMKLKDGSGHESVDTPHPMQLQKIYVQADFQRHGIGRELMNVCLARMEQAVPSAVWLAVLESNAKAVHFYESFGFATVGLTEYRFEDALFRYFVMRREADV